MQLPLFWHRLSPAAMLGTSAAILGTGVTLIGTILQNTNSGNGAEFGGILHGFGMMIMLLGGVLILASLMAKRASGTQKLASHEADGRLWLSPVLESECIILKPEGEPHEYLQGLTRYQRFKGKCMLASNCQLEESFFEQLVMFPSLAMIDLQNSRFDMELLEYVADLSRLEYLFLPHETPMERLKSLQVNLPEARIFSESISIGFADKPIPLGQIASTLATSQPGYP